MVDTTEKIKDIIYTGIQLKKYMDHIINISMGRIEWISDWNTLYSNIYENQLTCIIHRLKLFRFQFIYLYIKSIKEFYLPNLYHVNT